MVTWAVEWRDENQAEGDRVCRLVFTVARLAFQEVRLSWSCCHCCLPKVRWVLWLMRWKPERENRWQRQQSSHREPCHTFMRKYSTQMHFWNELHLLWIWSQNIKLNNKSWTLVYLTTTFRWVWSILQYTILVRTAAESDAKGQRRARLKNLGKQTSQRLSINRKVSNIYIVKKARKNSMTNKEYFFFLTHTRPVLYSCIAAQKKKQYE